MIITDTTTKTENLTLELLHWTICYLFKEKYYKSHFLDIHTLKFFFFNFCLSTRSGPGCCQRSAHQRELPRVTSEPRERAADEETYGARAEERQVQIQQQQGLCVHADAALRHRSWSVCSLQVFKGRGRPATLS